MKFITKKELENKDIVSQVSVVNNSLVLNEGFEYASTFDIGDIVTYKANTTKIGVISFIDEDDVNVVWSDNNDTTESQSDLVVIPPTIGLNFLKDSSILNLWENLSNGKSEDFDLKCIYVGDTVINEVPFIKAFKNTNVILDKKFKRDFTLYRKFGSNQIFRTNLYTICDNTVCLDTSRYVYYLLQGNVIYYLGIDLSKEDLSLFLFNK